MIIGLLRRQGLNRIEQSKEAMNPGVKTIKMGETGGGMTITGLKEGLGSELF